MYKLPKCLAGLLHVSWVNDQYLRVGGKNKIITEYLMINTGQMVNLGQMFWS